METNSGMTYEEQLNLEKQKRGDFYDSQSLIFQSVLSHVEEQVETQMDKVRSNEESRVLMIYTGGTIGMVNTESGYCVRPGFLQQVIKSNKYLFDSGYTYFNTHDDFMITPVSIYKKRIWYKLIEFEQIKDSSTFNTEEWIAMASLIEKEYNNYDAFVILHGTDTLAFTASALSFMFENLNKTVVLTGSQVPLSEMRNDAFDNLLGALTIAGHFTIPEVTVFFKDKLYRGNRAKKVDTFEFEAFESPNFPALGTFGFYLKLDWTLIRKPNYEKKFKVWKQLSKHIGVLKIFPMIPPELVASMLQSSIEAFIIEAYGAGNLPIDRPEIAKVLEEACNKGKVIVVISQCPRGTVNTLYAIGKKVQDIGITSGLDMTLECAVAKLSYLLGKGLSKEEIIAALQKDKRGELTEHHTPTFHYQHNTFIKAISDALTISTEYEPLKNAVFPTIMCYAADFGFVGVLQEMKKYGACFEVGDYEGRTPLHIAARRGHINVIQYLMEQGVALNSVDKYGRSALFEAIFRQRFDAAKILSQAGAKVLVDKEDFCDFIFKSVQKGDLESLKFLYYAGINQLESFKNIDDRTVGHIAVVENQQSIVEFLKDEANFNFNVKDRWGQTPLDEAKRLNYRNLVSLISEAFDMNSV